MRVAGSDEPYTPESIAAYILNTIRREFGSLYPNLHNESTRICEIIGHQVPALK